ncbi:MAG: GyrI-like domain-containing protein [Aminobacterium sp.]|jgi:AraC family transcriptional regulator|nr:GyrI-like domain-containing protein [Aminobacterium sp.]MDD3426743.1 GyrI-like domain-containing protein [Aminobacterium sp.]MDD3707380.1 GyrI-like domain-containing protein [Aminobacterium sp.]MDD4229382.1 GyrI-like domain-containing protein [Aminobacterium sp.]MDD4552260.1 GyrI-like domain-containing protein [Aminobacterium sp.]
MSGSSNYVYRIEETVAYIEQHLSEELKLQDISQIACFSPYHFHRIFTSIVGETPYEYITRLRLEKAANMLTKMNNLSITQIAFSCGFSSPATFARAFKKYYGVSGSKYRDSGGEVQGKHHVFAFDAEAIEKKIHLQVSIENLPGYTVAYVANLKGYSLSSICKAWNKLMSWGRERCLLDSTTMIGVSFDDPTITQEEKCRYHACVVVPDNVAITESDRGVGKEYIPSGEYAVGRAVCHAEEIRLAYRYLYGKWFPENGYQPADTFSYELYRALPSEENGYTYTIEVCIPLKPI